MERKFKKLLLLFSFLLLSSSFAYTEELTNSFPISIDEKELQNLLENTKKPTDEEILQHLKSYPISDEEASNLYQNVRIQLQKAYETGDVEHLKELQNLPEFQNVQNRIFQDIENYKNLNEQYNF